MPILQALIRINTRMKRLIMGLVLLIIAAVVIFFAKNALWLFMMLVVTLAGLEWSKLAPREKSNEEPSKKVGKRRIPRLRITEASLLVVSLLIVMLAYPIFKLGSLILIPLFLPISILLLQESEQHEMVGLACISVFGIGLVAIHDGFDIGGLSWVVVTVIAFDTAAFYGGRNIRGPLLWPEVSPNKRWSGLVVGLLVASLCGTLWLQIFRELEQYYGILGSFATSLLVALAAQAGDLAESRLKRRVKIKDSGKILPGHGGVLDRIDGFLCAVPVAFLLLSLQEKLQML